MQYIGLEAEVSVPAKMHIILRPHLSKAPRYIITSYTQLSAKELCRGISLQSCLMPLYYLYVSILSRHMLVSFPAENVNV